MDLQRISYRKRTGALLAEKRGGVKNKENGGIMFDDIRAMTHLILALLAYFTRLHRQAS
jgi:hypothetical protein